MSLKSKSRYSTRDRKYRRQKVVGRLSALEVYTKEGAMRFGGIGSKSLSKAIMSGFVKPIDTGHRHYYRGDQLIEWIKSCPEVQREKDGAH